MHWKGYKRENPTQLFFPFPPMWIGSEEERTGRFVLIVSEDKIVR
jgi:hypothetical protein